MTLRERWLPALLAGAFVVCMCWASWATGLDEVLFPETAAILCGCWILPRQAWNVSRPRMLLLMSSGGIFGLLLNLFVPAPVWARALMAYAFCALLMNVVGADMSPMLSAAILPVLLGTTSWLYPVVVSSLVILICLGQLLLEHAGLREPNTFRPLRDAPWPTLRSWARRFLVFGLLSAPAYLSGNVFFAVPPLVVAYTELTRPDQTLRLRPLRAWAALALGACIGSAARVAVVIAGVPLPAVAGVAFALLTMVWDRLRTWLPPAGAVMLLALLVPFRGPWLYPLEVSVGGAAWIAAAELLFPGVRPGTPDNAPKSDSLSAI